MSLIEFRYSSARMNECEELTQATIICLKLKNKCSMINNNYVNLSMMPSIIGDTSEGFNSHDATGTAKTR